MREHFQSNSPGTATGLPRVQPASINLWLYGASNVE
jgi:hypothetical protein